MRVNWNHIKLVLTLIAVVSLYAFAAVKSKAREVAAFRVQFLGESKLFITEEAVNKLLIQNNTNDTGVTKDILDLNQLELALNSNPMIKSAQVYLTVNGEVRAEVTQKKPIARVYTNSSFYVDDEGQFMPLSPNYSARVPLVTGAVSKQNLESVYKVAKYINEDAFLNAHIVEIHRDSDGRMALKSRIWSFDIELGPPVHLDAKMNNFKAFYQKALKDNMLSAYRKINLEFENQVVCTKA